VLRLSCLGICTAASAFAASHTCPSRAVRARIFGSSELPDAPLICGLPLKRPCRRASPSLLYFCVVALCSTVTELTRSIGSWEPQPDPFRTIRIVSVRLSVRPIDSSLLERDTRREFKPPLIADFVKRRLRVNCARVAAWAWHA